MRTGAFLAYRFSNIFSNGNRGLSFVGQEQPQVGAGNLLQNAIRDDARAIAVLTPAGKIGFAEIITGAENREVLDSAIATDLVGLATAADDSINVLARVTFLEQNLAFSKRFDGGMIEQVFKGAFG